MREGNFHTEDSGLPGTLSMYLHDEKGVMEEYLWTIMSSLRSEFKFKFFSCGPKSVPGV